MRVASSKDGFDFLSMCVGVSRKFREKTPGMNSVFIVIVWGTKLYHLFWGFMTLCVNLRRISVTSRRNSSEASDCVSVHWLALSDSVCLHVYRTFLCSESSWMKTPSRSHPSILWWRSTCPVLLKERGHADAFWQLCQAQEMASGSLWCCWVPPPCSHSEKHVDTHTCIHAFTLCQHMLIHHKLKKVSLLSILSFHFTSVFFPV